MAYRMKNGNWRSQPKRNGTLLADRVFPRTTEKSEIDDWERQIQLSVGRASYKMKATTFADFVPHYFGRHAAAQLLPSTIRTKRAMVARHLDPVLGHLKLSEVRPRHVLDLQSFLYRNGEGLSLQTIHNILSTASQIFMAAVEEEYMDFNPATSVRRLKDKTNSREAQKAFWSFSERDRFLEFSQRHDPKIFRLVAFAVTTGLRPGELWGLKRDMLDFSNNCVHVNRSWCARTNQLNQWTKSKVNRMVPVPADIMQILADRRDLKADQFVFWDIQFRDFGHRILKPMCRKAGVTPIRLYDLRHTFASHLVLKNLHQVEIRDLMGHSKVTSTDIYMHLKDADKYGTTECLLTGSSWSSSGAPLVN